MTFHKVEEFENLVAKFYGSPYAVAVDCCTHALELCLRLTNAKKITVPKHTYISVPFLADKLGIQREWKDENWEDYYYLTDNIIDAAVLWKRDSFISGTYMCISFQYRKHLSLGRGGVILVDSYSDYMLLKMLSYDGRHPGMPWRQQNISTMGYHYYMTPETAQIGIEKFETAVNTEPEKWVISDWPDLTTLDVFKGEVTK